MLGSDSVYGTCAILIKSRFLTNCPQHTAPSHAAEAMEMGADACLVNTAIAVAGQPVVMATAFKEAVIAGRRAYEAGLGAVGQNLIASASSPLTSFLD